MGPGEPSISDVCGVTDGACDVKIEGANDVLDDVSDDDARSLTRALTLGGVACDTESGVAAATESTEAPDRREVFRRIDLGVPVVLRHGLLSRTGLDGPDCSE